MWEDSGCKAPITDTWPKSRQTTAPKEKGKVFTAEWSAEYKMWVVYPILHYPDGSKIDASGQIIL